MDRLAQVAESYLGSQSVEDFLIEGGDPYEYAKEIFRGGLFGYENPASPELDIHDEADLAEALCLLCEKADIDAHVTAELEKGVLTLKVWEHNPFSWEHPELLFENSTPLADETQFYYDWKQQADTELGLEGYDKTSHWIQRGNHWLAYLELDPGS